MSTSSVEINELLDDQKLGSFHVLTLALCFCTLLLDGLDFSAVNVSAPAIIRAWHLPPSAMGMVFTAGNLGILVGTLIFGILSDRFGRRFGIIAGVLAFSIPGIATPFAGSVEHLAILRFVTGLGIGGVIPNVIALLSELAPKRARLGFVVMTFTGAWVGGAAAGLLAARLIPVYGWPIVFFAPGVTGVTLSILLALLLPESIRFLALKRPGSAQLRTLIRRLVPSVSITPQTVFTFSQPPADAERRNFRALFQGSSRTVTPLLWLGFFVESAAMVSLLSWTPFILEQLGLSPVQASIAFVYGSLCGLVSQLLLGRLIDRVGPLIIAIAAVIEILAAITLAQPALTTTMLMGTAAITFGLAGTIHNAFNGVAGAFYPTRIRGEGIGFAGGMGRMGSIVGPAVAGYVLLKYFSPRHTLYLLVTPYLLVIWVSVQLRRYYGGQLGDDAQSSTRSLEARA